MPQATHPIHELDVVAAPHARVIARTDGAGGLVRIAALDASEAAEALGAVATPEPGAAGPSEASLALSIDLVAAALARFGEHRGFGRLRSALIGFDGAVVAIGRDEGERSVVVIGDAGATPGLVLSHLQRALAKNGAPPETR